MTNAIFDLSNMFFRSMFIVGGFGKKQYTFDSQNEIDRLMRKVTTDVASAIRQLNPSRVIFALDSKSWRKNISIDENEGYKANRTKNEAINWDNIYKTMSEFADILKSNGFIVSQIDQAEADDLMALWKKELVDRRNEHVIMVTADEDIRQLVSAALNKSENKYAFSCVYNPFTMGKNSTKKLFASTEFEKWINNNDDIGDIFDRSIDVDKEDFQRILNSEIKLDIINGNEIALRKIFCGDDGDNVPAIYTWLSKTQKGDVKEVRITPSKYQKIKDLINPKSYLDLFDKNNMKMIEDKLNKIAGKSIPFKIEDRLERQIKLIVLQEDVFPKEIKTQFYKEVNDELKKPGIHPQSFNMATILEGTRYVDAKGKISSGNEASIFKAVDRITNKELF